MSISNFYRNYFNGFQEICNLGTNDSGTNALAVLKIASYFLVVVPLGVAALKGAESLYGRISQAWSSRTNERTRALFAKIWATVPENSNCLPTITLAQILSAYDARFKPVANANNLEMYSLSNDFHWHALTARIYYNKQQLSPEDALRVVFQREPTNMSMGDKQFNQDKLAELVGYRRGVYNEDSATKTEGSHFKDLPNTAAVYAETYLWNPPGGAYESRIHIACLSLPAPALDSPQQPHYNYYVQDDSLNTEKYTQEMDFLFRTIEQAIRDNYKSAFRQRGIRRVVLSKFGQGAFLFALTDDDKTKANTIFKTHLNAFIDRVRDLKLPIVMSEYTEPNDEQKWHNEIIVGDITHTAREGDLIVNAWDPHSAPGNGNDRDKSFDGAMGKASGILLTQTSWLNTYLRQRKALVAV